MSVQLRYCVDPDLKENYEAYIMDKYDQKWGKTGSELENAVKLYLTINGRMDYSDDPNVQELLEAAKKIPCAHTHSKDDSKDDLEERLEERFEQIQKGLAEVKKQLAEQERVVRGQKIAKEQSRYRDHSMDGLVSRFYDEYGDDQQVSYNDISQLIMKIHGVIDERSIMNRVQYLVASGCIETFAPNVFNIK